MQICVLLITALAATCAWSQSNPPRILMPINATDTGTISDSLLGLRLYYLDKGLELSIKRADVLNVYREKRVSRKIPRSVRMFLGTMTITESHQGSSIGRFEPHEPSMDHPLIRHKVPMNGDIVVPKLAIDSSVLFDPGVFQLKAGAVEEFDKIAQFVKIYNPSKMIIEGHTDSDGPAEANRKLSLERAEAVVQYLVVTYDFITPAMIDARGLGEAQPVVANDTPENKKLNRRIDIVIWE